MIGSTRHLFWLSVLGLGCLPGWGCQHEDNLLSSESFWNPFGLKLPFAADEMPIRIGVVSDGTGNLDVRAWWDITDRTPWTPLRDSLARHTRRPVQVEQLKLFQLALHLESGRLDFALLSDAQYAELENRDELCELVARADGAGRTGLIVAKADSDIDSIEKVSGIRFAFGPRGDPVLHYAAAAALVEGGVSIDEIQRELLPINSLQYHISSAETAKEIAYGTTHVGVIERSEYDAYPETGGRLFPLRFSKDGFRILGETNPIGLGPFVAARKADPELVESVRSFLTAGGRASERVVASLGISKFRSVTP